MLFLLKALKCITLAHVRIGKWWYSLGLDVVVIKKTVVYYVYMYKHNGVWLEV